MPAQSVASATAYYSENDTGPPLRRQLIDGNLNPLDLTDADTVTIIIGRARYSHYYSPYTLLVNRSACSIEDPRTDGWVNWEPAPGELSPPGQYHYVFEITWTDGTTQTVPANTYEALIVTTKPGGMEG